MYDKSIIAYQMSRFINMSLVINTLNKAVDIVPKKQRKGLILHSDQGVHFTNQQYRYSLNEQHIRHSVSYKGSCVDNCPFLSN